MIKLASWNVNGIRACAQKGMLDWLAREQFEIVCFQETKAWPEQLDESLLKPHQYSSFFAKAQKKGYSGVAFYIKNSWLKSNEVKIEEGLGASEFDNEGRTLILEAQNFILYNCYFPNGQHSHARVPYKLDYCRFLAQHALAKKEKTGKEIIICGDYNTAHTEIDLKNPKSNKNSTGFLLEERAWIDEFIEQGFYDVFRAAHPEEEGHYTWWSYRSKARERNIGWRIDYFFVTEGLLKDIHHSYHQPKVLGSDHCPVGLDLRLD